MRISNDCHVCWQSQVRHFPESEERHVPRNCLRARNHSSLNCDVQAIVFAQPTAIIRLSWLSAMALPSRRHALTSPHCHALTMSFRQPLQPWWLSEPLPKTSHGWRCNLVHVVVPSCSSRHSRMSYSKIPQPHSTAPCNNGTPCTSEMGLEGLMMALLLS